MTLALVICSEAPTQLHAKGALAKAFDLVLESCTVTFMHAAQPIDKKVDKAVAFYAEGQTTKFLQLKGDLLCLSMNQVAYDISLDEIKT